MVKKKIRVVIEGKLTQVLETEFHNKLANIIIEQYGVQEAKEILNNLKLLD